MNFYDPKVVDILRSNQRDECFINDIENNLHTLLKNANIKLYQKIQRAVPIVANFWYYSMTSLSNLQTLGEEYTGTLRVTETNQLPSKLRQTLWLILYIGGDGIVDRFLSIFENKIDGSTSLTVDAKWTLVKCIQCFKEQKELMKRLHRSLFYINGKYYNVSNRIAGIKYVLLREWMQDSSFSRSFELLGKLSLFYILLNTIQNFLINNDYNTGINQGNISKDIRESKSMKLCVLCNDKITFPTATPCGHVYCWSCLQDSLSYQNTCPICREIVIPNRIIFLQNYI